MSEKLFVVVVFGLPGSGKSYFAEQLARKLDATNISSDVIRNRFFKEKDYSISGKDKVYQKMVDLMQHSLKRKESVILDATFCLNKWRKMVMEKVDNSVPLYYIEIFTSNDLTLKRTAKKRLTSDADYNVYKEISKGYEPMDEPHLFLESTNDNVEQMAIVAMDYLQLKEMS